MFLGHYGVALAAKRAAPDESLGTTVAAAQWADLLWPILLLVGLEEVRIVPGLMAASALDFVRYPITHSLLTVLGWAAAGGALWLVVTGRRRGALVVALLVVSHWLLDLPMHRPDLPLWPGGPTVGGGLWSSLPLTLAIELGLLAVGVGVYLRATRPRDGIGRWGLAAFVGILVAFWVPGLFQPPPSEQALAWGGLFLWLFVPWAWWVDRHREGVGPAGPAGAEAP